MYGKESQESQCLGRKKSSLTESIDADSLGHSFDDKIVFLISRFSLVYFFSLHYRKMHGF